MSETVVFSQLSRKFIDENDATPAEAQQVVYYSLAIGHHLGIIDCLEAALTCPWDDYLAWIATLAEGSEARRKMAKSSSILTMCRCWRARLMTRSPCRHRNSRNGASWCSACCMTFTRKAPSI